MEPTTFDQYQPVEHASAWRSADFSDTGSLSIRLESRHKKALERALSGVRGVATADITRANFQLHDIEDDVARIREEVLSGRGLILVKGFPVDHYDADDMARMFFGLGTHIGNAVSQSRMGDRIGHVVDASRDPNERGYRSSRELSLHTDSNDVVMMLCLRAAATGGMNRFTSSIAIYNELARTAPQLLPALFEGFPYHWRGEQPEGEPPITDYRVPVFSRRNGVVSCVFLRDFINMASEEREQPLSEIQQEALARFEQIANHRDNVLNVQLRSGDAFLINNFTVLHSRTAFEDAAPPAPGRHLIRLWLASPGARPLVDEVQRYYGNDGIQPRAGAGTIYKPEAAR